jgi:peptidoglycan/xylan/chitin deacetylase (PgdA/CDA1 family)
MYYNQNKKFGDKTGLIMTFDDGLSDHFEVAKILSENNISGVFFIPTCIIKDRLPANPIILHYAIAIHGLKKFIDELKIVFNEIDLEIQNNIPEFNKKEDNVWKIINDIKILLYYTIKPDETRKILIKIYKRLIIKENITINDIHLTKIQINKLLEMGHSIGAHSHSHISVASSKLSKLELNRELIEPKKILESEFNTNVISMSYPFGELKDCLSAQSLIQKTNTYELAFTIDHKLNTKNISPLEIGRYMVHSSDNSNKLNKILKNNQIS